MFTLHVSESAIYLGQFRKVLKVDAKTGNTLYTYEDLISLSFERLIVANGSVIAGDSDGKIICGMNHQIHHLSLLMVAPGITHIRLQYHCSFW